MLFECANLRTLERRFAAAQNTLGRMPVAVFADALLMGANRALLRGGGAAVIAGPLSPCHLAAPLPGKIAYPQSKQTVLAPTDWSPALAARSAALPDRRLALEWVFGYDGRRATSSNLAYTAAGELVYTVAAVAVVYDRAAHTQRFFLGHTDDITCLAVHPHGALVATGQVAAAETPDGPGVVRRADPFAAVWETGGACARRARLFHGRGMRGVQCVAFSPSGGSLASVCADDAHTLCVWRWEEGQCVCRHKTRAGAPPSVYGVSWCPFDSSRLATHGQNHVMFWRLRKDAESAQRKVLAPPPSTPHWRARACVAERALERTCLSRAGVHRATTS